MMNIFYVVYTGHCHRSSDSSHYRNALYIFDTHFLAYLPILYSISHSTSRRNIIWLFKPFHLSKSVNVRQNLLNLSCMLKSITMYPALAWCHLPHQISTKWFVISQSGKNEDHESPLVDPEIVPPSAQLLASQWE